MHTYEQTTSVLNLKTTGALMNKAGEPVLVLPNPFGAGFPIQAAIPKQNEYSQNLVRKACAMVEKWVQENPNFLADCEVEEFTGVRGTSFTRYKQEYYIVFEQKNKTWGVICVGTHSLQANYVDITIFASRELAIQNGVPSYYHNQAIFANFTNFADCFNEQTYKELGKRTKQMLDFPTALIWALRNYKK
jgi:hypothetical protein